VISLRQASNALEKVCGSVPLSPPHPYEPNAPKSAATTEQLSEIGPSARNPAACASRAARVTAIMDGKVKVLGTEPPEFSSAATKWSGFLLERHNLVGVFEEVGWHSSHVIMCLGGSSVVRVSGGAGNAHCVVQPGRIFIFPSGCRHTNISVAGDACRFVVAELDSTRLQRLFFGPGSPSEVSLAPQLNIDDAPIVAIIGNMLAEAAAGCQCGALYGESLSLSLAAYVAARYSLRTCGSDTAEHGFSSTQAQTVIDYVHAHLRRDLTLLELADAMDLSPRHFSRLFRTTFGTTPHRYVIAERVNEAKVQLATKRLAIVEIAEALGFADQSHLTNVFRRVTGVSPRRYQREC
jgi:AraC-like DNA-binding protein